MQFLHFVAPSISALPPTKGVMNCHYHLQGYGGEVLLASRIQVRILTSLEAGNRHSCCDIYIYDFQLLFSCGWHCVQIFSPKSCDTMSGTLGKIIMCLHSSSSLSSSVLLLNGVSNLCLRIAPVRFARTPNESH